MVGGSGVLFFGRVKFWDWVFVEIERVFLLVVGRGSCRGGCGGRRGVKGGVFYGFWG